MQLFVTEVDEDCLITHDGDVQLGYYKMSMRTFMEMSKGAYVETYWVPDVATSRYKKINYQKHMKSASIETK